MAFEYDRKISIGNLITIGMVLVGALSAFFAVQAQVGELSRNLEKMQADASSRAAKADLQISSAENRLRAVEITQASQTSDLRTIQIGINEIKDQLQRLADRQQELGR